MAELGFEPSLCDIKGALYFAASLADYLRSGGENVLRCMCGVGEEGSTLRREGGRGRIAESGVFSLEAFSRILSGNYIDKMSGYVCCRKTFLFIAG